MMYNYVKQKEGHLMKIIAFTGAGISKQSNIPTFMERPDIREKLFRDYANTHHEEYNEVVKQLKANMNGAKPNDAHIALAQYKIPVITMNIDGLHKQAGSDALELHGGLPEDDEMDIAWSLYNKPVLYGDPAPNYAKAYESLVIAKKRYLDDLDLKDVQTLGEIIRITVDAGNASYGCDERHYLFDTDMRLIDVYRKCHEDNCLVNGMDAYRCYIPVPFKAGDIVKCVSPYHETYYGVFPYDWEEPKNKYGISMYASLDTYYAKEKLFEITDDTLVLELSKCKHDELPEDQRILKVISAVRKGELDFYTVLNRMSFHELDDMVTWFYKK